MENTLWIDLVTGKQPVNSLIGLEKDTVDEIAGFGYQAWEQGDKTQAESIFAGLVALDHRLAQGHAGLGMIRLREGRLDEAFRHLNTAAQVDPMNCAVQADLGETLLRQRRLEEATPHLRLAVDLEAGRAGAAASRAQAMLLGIETVWAVKERTRTAGSDAY